MAAKTVSPTTTVVVLLALLLLTGLTVSVSFVSLSPGWHLRIGLSIAGAKATLVVLFFMHVVHSRAAIRAVIVVAVFWLVGVLMALTFSDYTTREAIQVGALSRQTPRNSRQAAKSALGAMLPLVERM